VSRRASLPGAAELFRSTATARTAGDSADARDAGATEPTGAAQAGARRGTGRQRHDTKITVYVADEELLSLERARLSLRAEHGLAVDRGRIVREAIAMVLADLDEHGTDASLVHRLRQEPRR
jgi:hypothetical protein